MENRMAAACTEVARSGAAASSAGLSARAAKKVEKEVRSIRVGQHWDNKLGPQFDVLVAANVIKLRAQMRFSEVCFFGIDCKSFSRARGRPIPGARW